MTELNKERSHQFYDVHLFLKLSSIILSGRTLFSHFTSKLSTVYMLKQQKLSFATAKRTASGSNVGKSQVSTPSSSKPVQTLVKDSNSKEIKEEDRYADIKIADLSSSDDDEEEDSRAKPEDVKASTDVRTPVTRSTSKKSASSTPSSSASASKAKLEDATTETVPSPRMLQESNQTAEALAKKVEANVPKEKEELRELNPKDTKYRKHYTEIKKKMGGMPTIHGEKQNKIHEILRVFDDSYDYGPCVGMTRLERWQRAKKLGFNPPQEVYDILTTKQGKEKPEYAECVFYGEV
ncbi:unnamed protein product [Cyclocybe aegerita]|uniref:DNA polymerase delta subunit 4 n=1 Tax=Cyclocybe aegerita TaxID=1973307 RepID=A0A8S0W6U9_CYCAE|nr:unnamed protein product [Cyclocybe aegerita]